MEALPPKKKPRSRIIHSADNDSTNRPSASTASASGEAAAPGPEVEPVDREGFLADIATLMQPIVRLEEKRDATADVKRFHNPCGKKPSGVNGKPQKRGTCTECG